MVAEEVLLTVEGVNQRLPLVRTIVRDIMELHRDILMRKQRMASLRERYPASGGDRFRLRTGSGSDGSGIVSG